MKPGWTTVTLDEVTDIGAGNPAPQDKRLFENGKFPFFRTADVGRVKVGELRDSQDKLNDLGIRKLRLHRAGTILIPKSGASTFLDHRVIMCVDGYVSGHLATLWAREEVLDRRFLFWVTQKIVASEVASDASYPTLSLEQIRGIEIPLPSLEEQRRIVDVLDEAFATVSTATANAETNLANAEALYESVLLASFDLIAETSPMKRIGEIAAVKGGKRVPKGYKLQTEPTPFPYLTVGDFNDDGSIDESALRYVSSAVQAQIKRYVIRSEDLYVSIAGTIGRTGIIPPSLDGAQLTENACRLVFQPGCSNRFVYHFTRSPSFKEQAIEQTRTTAQPKLALSRLEQICLPVPSLEEQQAWIAKFDTVATATQRLRDTYLTKLEQLDRLKQSLLKRALSGELAGTQVETIAI